MCCFTKDFLISSQSEHLYSEKLEIEVSTNYLKNTALISYMGSRLITTQIVPTVLDCMEVKLINLPEKVHEEEHL